MNHRANWLGVSALTLAVALTGCGASSAAQTTQAGQPTSAARSTAPTPTAIAGQSQQTAEPLSAAAGAIRSEHDVNLVFTVSGIVADVKVKEGDMVKQGDVLATLDPRPFDEAIEQAQAAVDVAIAQQNSAGAAQTTAAAAQTSAAAQRAALTDQPKSAAVRAAQAQVQAARVNVAQAQTGQTQDAKSAQAAVTAAQANLQTTRDRLSAIKTQADTAVQQAGDTLTQAQASYSVAKSNWEYVQETGNNPSNPSAVGSDGKKKGNSVTDSQKEQYYAAFVQAEAALRLAEKNVEQAQVTADNAHQAEVTGDQAAEQSVTTAQATLDKIQVPATEDRVASAQASLALAQANLANLYPDARPSQRTSVTAAGQQAEAVAQQAEAGINVAKANVAAAQAAVKRAQTNREYAEMHAPFDAIAVAVNINAGSAAGLATSGTAIRLVDIHNLRFEAQVSDSGIGQITVGQPARIRLDSMPDAPLNGKVSYIASEATVAGTARTFTVRVALDQQDSLRVGMSGQVEFLSK